MKIKIQKSEFEQKLRESEPDMPPHKQDEKTIPVVEEKIDFDKRTVEKGKVHISKQVHEEEVTVDVPFAYEEVDVQHIPRNIPLESPPEVRYDGDKMIIPVVREEVVVQKRLILVEELHITKKKIEEKRPQHVRLLKEEVKVTRTRGKNSNPKA